MPRTSIAMKANNGDLFWGRTDDFTFSPFKKSVKTQITAFPKNTEMPSRYHKWMSKYAFVGINVNNSLFYNDGINSEGLVGDAQYLEECSWDTEENLKKRGLTPIVGAEFVSYILSNFKDITEIKEAIPKLALLKTKYQPWEDAETGIPSPIPMHFTFFDPSGKGIVLEPVNNGAFKIYDSIGVMTNSPEYSWHLNNLRNYVQMRPHNVGENKLNDQLVIKQIESGSGLLGLPGDYTPPSRFIRATFLSNYIDSFKREDGIMQLYDVFKTVMIPKGLEKLSANSTKSDYTGYWIGYHVTKHTLYIQPECCNTFTQFTLSADLKEKTIK